MRPTPGFAAKLACCLALATALAPAARAGPPERLADLRAAASVVRDGADIAHVRAGNEHDLFFLQGYVHAEDRLFQLDVTRRRASGTLAELLGPAALAGDVQLRTFGLRRAAERTWPVLEPRTRAALQAYADGVNAWAATHPLPPEYAALELTTFAPWTALDSVACAKLIAFGLSFDLDDVTRTAALAGYRQAGAALGFDGAALFREDLWRSAPFDPASTVPDASIPARRGRLSQVVAVGRGARTARPAAQASAPARALPDAAGAELAARFLREVRANPFLARMLDRGDRDGSNQWVIAPRFSASGRALLASDPHLALGTPSTFYPIHLQAGPIDVIGNSFPGVPSVVVGHNNWIAWGATVDPFDVTDVYQERIVPDATSPSGLSTVYLGKHEPVIPIPESYRVNLVGDTVLDDVVPAPAGATPAATLIVPRRNDGPIVQLDAANGVALSVQYTGAGATRELETFLGFDEARDLDDFVRALRKFDSGSQNFCYADVRGNIAYFTNSAVPVREDLQANAVHGLPPWFIRDGTGGNEWLPVQHRQPGQIVPFEVLPLEELPRIVNPPAGFAVNANNDPAGLTLGNDPLARQRPGGGVYYLAPGFDGGFRAGRITHRVREILAARRMRFEDMQSIQADVRMLDAQVLVPSLTAALGHARRDGAPADLAALAADPALAEAVGRLAAWDGWAPTGIREGYDASDVDGRLVDPTREEIDASVAATLYATWRGQAIAKLVDARIPAGLPRPPSQQAVIALRHLLDRFPEQKGIGASGLDFVAVPGSTASPEDRRDLLLLGALRSALDLLAGPAFDPAFHGSTAQGDYRWGKLHRIVFAHPMGGPFSVPPALGAFPAPLAGLPGLPTDGGFGVPDASNHDARAASANAFMFSSGPSNRLVVELARSWERPAESAWPGGVSAVPGTTGYLNLLPLWLTNDTVELPFKESQVRRSLASETRYVP